MKEMKLTNRLAAIAAYAVSYKRVADVGTDHCYLPVWLLQSGKVKSVIASDINEGPLKRAKETAGQYGINKGLELVLSDGISHLDCNSIDAIIVAGMGGETITDILSGSNWVSDGKHALILQPMTKTEELTHWLSQNGMRVSDATLAEDDGEIYLILFAESGEYRPSAYELYAPRILLEKYDPLLREYLDRLIRRLSLAVDGLKSSKTLRDTGRLLHLELVLNGLLDMRGEIACADCK